MSFFIETDRLILRELTHTDVDGMFQLDSDVDVHRYLGKKPITKKSQAEANIKTIRQQYHDHGIGRWAMINKTTQEFMGWVGLKLNTTPINNHNNFYDIGYRIIKHFWGQGYATESAKAVLNYGFNTLRLNKIYGITELNNQASHQVLLKIGLSYINDFYDNNTQLKLRWYAISKSIRS